MSNSTPRILHISGRTFWCGESNRILVVCRGLHAKGWHVILGAPPESELAKRAMAEGLPVDTRFKFRRGLRPLSLMRDVHLLRKIQTEQSFDVIHAHTSTDTWPVALAFGGRPRHGKPWVVRTRHSDHQSKSDMAHQWLYRYAIDHVVLSAGALRKPLAGLYRTGAITEDRTTVIHSSVNIHRFDPANVSGEAIRQEFGLSDKFCIGLIGRISSEKGHALLLAALPEILRAEPRAVCVFAGSGDQEERIKRELAQSPLRGHVVFTGFRDDIPRLMAAMDLVVVPSTRVESSPGVVKEGMAMNKPVIAADVGGVSEIIRHGEDGWVIPPGDVTALQEAVIHFIRHPELRRRISANARPRVVSEFSDERLVENNMNLYRKLIGLSS